MSVSAGIKMNITVTETLENNTDSLSSNRNNVLHDGFDFESTLTSGSTAPATKVAAFEITLPSGTGSIDLTALTGTNSAEVDGTGLKVQAIKFAADADNTEVVTIADGASNGYELAGDAWTLDLAAGQHVMLFGNDAAPDISGTAKVIDLSSSDTDAKVNCIVLMG